MEGDMKQPNKNTSANAGWALPFRFRGSRHRPGVAEFWRWTGPKRPNVLMMVIFVSAAASRVLAGDVVVSAKITHSGIDELQRPVFAIEAKVKNLSSNSVSFATMRCSWD